MNRSVHNSATLRIRSNCDDAYRWAVSVTTRMGIGRNVCWIPEMNEAASNQHMISQEIEKELQDETD